MTRGAAPLIATLGLAVVLAGCGSNALNGPGGRPIALTVAVPAPLRAQLAPIVHAADRRAAVTALTPAPGPAPAADVVIAIGITDGVAHPGLLAPGFAAGSLHGQLASSTVAFGVTPGNPLGIRGWGDLLAPDVRVALADPLGAAGGRLEVLAAATAVFAGTRHGAPARDYVRRLLTRADVTPAEGAAIDHFAGGAANVVVSTEDRLLAARDRGVPLQIVYPPTALRISIAAGVGARAARPRAAQALVDALTLPGPQKALARAGLRPVLVGYAPPDRFPALPDAHTPGIMGKPGLVAHAYFGPAGVAATAAATR